MAANNNCKQIQVIYNSFQLFKQFVKIRQSLLNVMIFAIVNTFSQFLTKENQQNFDFYIKKIVKDNQKSQLRLQ